MKSKKSSETLPVMNSNRPTVDWNLSNVNDLKSPPGEQNDRGEPKLNSEKQLNSEVHLSEPNIVPEGYKTKLGSTTSF